jgi:uncharacterized protein (DUF362 family)
VKSRVAANYGSYARGILIHDCAVSQPTGAQRTKVVDRELTTKIVKIEDSLDKALDDVLKNFDIPRNKRVFIKPNLCDPCKPDSGVVTNVRTVRSLIRHLKERGIKDIVVGEGVNEVVDMNEVMKATRFGELRNEGIKVLDLEKVERTTVKWKYGTLQLPKIVFDSFYINMPLIKTHTQTVITASIKNQKGLLLSRDKKLMHRLGLQEPLAYLAKTVKPDLVLVDGIWGLEGDGPSTAGKRKKVGLLIASDNMVEADSVCAQVVGVNPKNVEHLAFAEEVGVGRIRLVKGVQSLKFKPPNQRYFSRLRLRYWRNPYACTQCADATKETLKEVLKNPHRHPRAFISLALNVGILGVDVLAGKNAAVPKECRRDRILCVGDCTTRLAREHNLLHAQGCPPPTKNMINAISKLRL